MKVGILALQGDYEAHAVVLKRLSVKHQYIKTPNQLSMVQGLIIPGGESTTLSCLLTPDFMQAIRAFSNEKKPILGTCAGAILLANEVLGREGGGLSLMQLTLERNAYGRQLSSRYTEGTWVPDNKNIPMVFIRAPKILSYGQEARVLATQNKEVVCVQEKNCIAAMFHAELTDDLSLHQFFLKQLIQ